MYLYKKMMYVIIIIMFGSNEESGLEFLFEKFSLLPGSNKSVNVDWIFISKCPLLIMS